jgi:hypothetical protein
MMKRAASCMRYIWIWYCLLMSGSLAIAQSQFVRSAYFQAFEQDAVTAMDEQLNATERLSGTDRDAFEGALLMRKAGLQSSPVQKLSLFKQGAQKLEAAIKAQPNNAEYRFLRLMIQENAPKILGYRDQLKQDGKMVTTRLKTLDPATRAAVQRYAAQSKYL